MLFSSGQTIATSEIVTKMMRTSYNIIQHSPTRFLRGGQTEATLTDLTPNNVELCCVRLIDRDYKSNKKNA